MNSFFLNSFINSSFTDDIVAYWSTINVYLCETFLSIRDQQTQSVSFALENLPEYLVFNELQHRLLKGFLLVLLTKLFLIFCAWRIFGKRICDRFMRPATSKAIEELKASVSKLKLPKEHTPRI